MLDLQQHLIRQMAWSKATFGPGTRRNGVIDHITKELKEVETAESINIGFEWVDVVILALDGLTREIWQHQDYRLTADRAADLACKMILLKQAKNERRNWPDWRTADPEKAIEHIKPA